MAVYDHQKLFSTLSELSVIPPESLSEAFQSSQQSHRPFHELLLEKDLISDENLGKIIADSIATPFVRLSETAIPDKILTLIPESVAKKQRIIAFKKDTQGLHLAMADPSNLQIRSFVKKKVGTPLIVYFATDRDLAKALSRYAKDIKHAFEDIISQNIKEAQADKNVEPPIIKIVDAVINYAYQNTASDVHMEPIDRSGLIRFRIDGILHDVAKLPLSLYPQIVTRIKVLSKLRTDEHQAAQDGKIRYPLEGEALDIRVSIVPITEGEKVVMRLLSARSREFSLQDLGFSEADFEKVRTAYQKPYGMILATGPTGCGKTTSLYAVLKLLNKRGVNIMTIEDPVEYGIEGVNQIQVNPKTELTFANGLRSIVRQDPDIILVGEIRDQETADIAINAAMTGHLVLSTLHTNDAATAIPRLLDMGVEPFLLASTVNVIIAQRLVRKICQSCRLSRELKDLKTSQTNSDLLALDLVKKHFKSKSKLRLYQGKGCPVCHQTGYSGRIGIFEVLIINDQVRESIVARQDAAAIKKIAVKYGMNTMLSDGLDKVERGVTTLEEVVRVVKE